MQRRRRTSNNVQHELRGPAEPLFRTASAEPLHLASQDYPELEEILVERPPLERSIPTNQGMRSFRTSLAKTAGGTCPCCYGSGEHSTGLECYACDSTGQGCEFDGNNPCDGALGIGAGGPLEFDTWHKVGARVELQGQVPVVTKRTVTVTKGWGIYMHNTGNDLKVTVPAGTHGYAKWFEGGKYAVEFNAHDVTLSGPGAEGLGEHDMSGNPTVNFKEDQLEFPQGNPSIQKQTCPGSGQQIPTPSWSFDQAACPGCGKGYARNRSNQGRFPEHTRNVHVGAILSQDVLDPGNVDDSEPKEELTMSDDGEGREVMGSKEAAWADVQEKAIDIFHLGAVRMLASDKEHVAAHVLGDHGTYLSEIQLAPGSKSPAMWNCSCPWSAYSWGRSGRWKKYEGRMCSHALALYYQYQSDPKPIPNSDWDTDKITEYIAPPPKAWRVAAGSVSIDQFRRASMSPEANKFFFDLFGGYNDALHGGCGVVAEAARILFGGEVEAVVINSPGHEDFIEHIVCKTGSDQFVDGKGVRSARAICTDDDFGGFVMSDGSFGNKLRPMTPELRAKNRSVGVCPPGAGEKFAEFVRNYGKHTASQTTELDENSDDEAWNHYLNPADKFDDTMMMEGSIAEADEKEAVHLFTTIKVNNQHAQPNPEHDGFRYAYHQIMGDANMFPNPDWADPAFQHGEDLAHAFLKGVKTRSKSTGKKVYRAIGLSDEKYNAMIQLLADGSVDLPPASWSTELAATQEFGFMTGGDSPEPYEHRILFVAAPGTKSWPIGQMSKRKDQREHIVGGRFHVNNIAPVDIDGVTTTVSLSQDDPWPDDFHTDDTFIEHMIFDSDASQQSSKTSRLTFQAEYTGGGTMVAVGVPMEIAEALAIEGGEEPEELHVTLAYIKSGTDFDQDRLIAAVERTANYYAAVDAEIAGYGVFQNGEQDVLFALPSSDLLWFLRQVLIEELETEGIEYSSDHAWQPHITLKYDETETPDELPDEAKGKFDFGGLIIGNKDGQANYPFAPAQHVASGPMSVEKFEVGDRVLVGPNEAPGTVTKVNFRNNGYNVTLDDEYLATQPSFATKDLRAVTPLNMKHASKQDDLVQAIRNNLTDDLRKPHYQGNPNPMAGHCYVASEALYHLLGGKAAGYKAFTINHEGEPHWFLKDAQGNVIDPTADQFTTPVPYDQARGIGFLTGDKPSKRAQTLLSRLNYTTAANDFVTLYHGTDKANVPSIQANGIRPTDPARSAMNIDRKDGRSFVYLTKKADDARGYGFGDEDAVIEVRVPKTSVEKMPLAAGTFLHEGTIPPEQIVSISAKETVPLYSTSQPLPGEDLARAFAISPGATDYMAEDLAVISLAYRDMPVVDPAVVPLWQEFGRFIDAQVADLRKTWDIQFVDYDPYEDAAEMFADCDRGVYKVTTLHAHHPVWSTETNCNFRALHDITGHYAVESDFSFRGEVLAYQSECTTTPEQFWPVLFTEVIAQTAYANVHHLFGEQKVGLIAYSPEEVEDLVGQVVDAPDPAYDAIHVSAAGGTEILGESGTGEFSENPEQENPKDSENEEAKTASILTLNGFSDLYVRTQGQQITEGDYYALVDHYVEMHARMPSDKELAKLKRKVVGTLNDSPEPALPSTDGDILNDEGDDGQEIRDDVWQADGVKMASDIQDAADGLTAGEMEDDAQEENEVLGDETQADGVGQFYRSASMGIDIPLPQWLMTGGSESGAKDSSDIAKAAREHLAHKTFSPAEQRELIDEGQDAKAANLHALDLAGTHYEQLEAALAQADASGEDVFWW